MLNGAACSQSYSAWRYLAFRRLLEDVQGASGASLPFLHPKTLHQHRRQQSCKRHYHASSASCVAGDQPSSGSEARVNPAFEEQTDASNNLQLRPRIVRKVRSEVGTEPNQGTEETPPWKPTSQVGQRDLRSLAQSLKAMSVQFKQTAQEDANRGKDSSPQQPDDYLELPTSPLEKHMQKKKWNPKRRPTTEEKEKLAGNPWAAMLAGPLRLDAASKARFPDALFMDFGHVVSPADDFIYMVPDSLADLQAFVRRLKNGHRSAAMKRKAPDDAGAKVRILPYKLLLEELTDSFMVWDNVNHAGRTKKGAIAKRLFPVKWQEKAHKIEAYRSASKEYWDLREKQGETDDGLFKRLGQGFDSNRLQWQPEMVDRIPNVMRQRVLLALNHVAQMQDQPKNKERELFYSFQWPETRSLLLSDRLPKAMDIAVEYWNDMGDIESAQAITGTGERQGDSREPRPPIAIQPSEIPLESAETQYDQPDAQQGLSTKDRSELTEKSSHLGKDDPRVWLPGSFVLHIGPPHQSLANLPYINSSSILPSDYYDASHPAFEHSKYIPPMITVGGACRLPVFNIPAMLGPKFDLILRRILQRHRQHIHIPDQDPQGLNHVIIIKSVAPGSHFLAQELWQLWRYLGGRDCLLAAAARLTDAKLDRHILSERDGSPVLHERVRKSKTGYRGLSDAAWDHLHELLGLKHEKKQSHGSNTLSDLIKTLR